MVRMYLIQCLSDGDVSINIVPYDWGDERRQPPIVGLQGKILTLNGDVPFNLSLQEGPSFSSPKML